MDTLPRQPLACPTEAQVVAMLNAHATHEMLQACRLTGCLAQELVEFAVAREDVTWAEVMWEPCYAIAQIFDDFLDTFMDDLYP